MPSRTPTATRPNVALSVIVVCQLMLVLDATVVNIALTPIKHALHFSPGGLSWVIDAYSLTFGGLLLLGGRAGDVFGRRRLFMAGLALFTVASLAGGLAVDSTMLLVTRAVQGIGAAMASPSTLSLISATFEEGPSRNKALGVFTAVSAGGGSLGLVLGGALTSFASWRWVLFINVPIGIAILLLTPRFVPEPPRNGGRLDVAGALLVTLGLGGFIYAFIRLAERSGTGVTVALFVAGAALLAAFVVVEGRRPQPLMPMRLLTDRVRGSSYLVFLLVPAVMFGVFFFISQYLEASLHYSAIRAGVAFLPLTGLIFLSSRVTPRIIARAGTRPLLLFGLVVLAVATIWISRATPTEGYWTSLFGPLLLFGLGAGSCFMPLSVTILTGVPMADAGAASGMLQTMQQTGAALGVAALSSVAVAHGRRDALEVAAAIGIVALLAAAALIRRPATSRSGEASEAVEDQPVVALVE